MTTLQLCYEVWQDGSMVGRYQTLHVAIDAVNGLYLDHWNRWHQIKDTGVTIRTVRGWIDRTDGDFKVTAIVDEMAVPI